MSPGRSRRRDPRPPRRLRREGDGSLYELDEHRRISISELADEVRAGRRFRVTNHDGTANCTNQVLLEVLQSTTPGVSGFKQLADAPQNLAGALGAMAGGLAQAMNDRQPAEPPRRTARRAQDQGLSLIEEDED